MQCPPDFPAVGAIIVLSAVVGRQVAIRPKRVDDWQVVPNLWGGIVGRPGLLKTPALQEVLRPLAPLERRAKEDYEGSLVDYDARLIVAEAQQKEARKNVQKAVQSGRDAYELALAAQSGVLPPALRRYRTNDVSVEKLGELLNENPRGLLLFRDELTGFLQTLDKDGHESARSFYLESWNGNGGFVYDRIGRGTTNIEAACVSILGGIQPGPLSAYLARTAAGGMDDDGLVQRFQLVVWPDPSPKWRDVDTAPDDLARQKVFEVFERLDQVDAEAIGADVGEGVGALPFLRFNHEAQKLFTDWRSDLEGRLRGEDLPSVLEAHLAKYRSLIPSLALLIHLVDVGYGPVEEEALLRALAWGEYLETHARRVYAPLLTPDVAGAKALATHIKKGDLGSVFTAREVQRKRWTGLVDRSVVQAALELLEDLEWLKKVQHSETGGRPRVDYLVNPMISQSVRAA